MPFSWPASESTDRKPVRISLVDEPAGMYDEVSENTGSLEPPVCSVR